MTELVAAHDAALARWYDAAETEVDRLAREMLQEEVAGWEDHSPAEKRELVQRAKQDILIRNVELGTFLSYLDMKSRETAALSLIDELSNDAVTDEQRVALVDEQQLRVLQATELEVHLVTGNVLAQIDATASYADSPYGYERLNEMAEAAGISASERSDTMALSQTIFPYIEQVLRLDPRDLWARVGKARFRRIVPILRTIMQPSYDGTERVREQIEVVRRQAARDTNREPGQVNNQEVAAYVLEMAETHSVRNLNQNLRGDDRNPFILHFVVQGEDVEVSGNITADDLELIRRRLNEHAEFIIERQPLEGMLQ